MYRFGEKIPELIELSLIYILYHILIKTQVIQSKKYPNFCLWKILSI